MNKTVTVGPVTIVIGKLLEPNNWVSITDSNGDDGMCIVRVGEDMYEHGHDVVLGSGKKGHLIYEAIKKELTTPSTPKQTNPISGIVAVVNQPGYPERIYNCLQMLAGAEMIVSSHPQVPESQAVLVWHDKYHSMQKNILIGMGADGAKAAQRMQFILNSGVVELY